MKPLRYVHPRWRATNQTRAAETHSWAVYHLKGTPAKLVAIIDAPDEATAIVRAIEGRRRD
jgi:hypothetical protein